MIRRLLPLALVAALLAVVATAQATPPSVTLYGPTGQTTNQVTITGKAGSNETDLYSVTINIYNGDKAEGKAVTSLFRFVNESTREFSATLEQQLPDGLYSATATQSNEQQETGTSNVIVFRIGAAPEPEETPTASPTPTATATATAPPVTQAATPTATPTPTPTATPYTCKSRRDFVKHVLRPSKGKDLKVTATLDGKPYKFTVTRRFVLLRMDLRGMLKDTYTLKVTLKFTRPDGKRVTKNSVAKIDYHTCVPRLSTSR